MYRGFIKLWRKIWDNPISKKPAYLSVFLFCIKKANHEDTEIIWDNQKTMIKRGSFITSSQKIAENTGVPRGTVERILKYLKNELMIEEQTTKKFRLISVVNYDQFQNSEEVNEEQVRNKRGTSEEQVDTEKNYKELKRTIKKENATKVASLQELIEPYKEKYTPSLLQEFVEYWTEKSICGRKERWQTQKFFDPGKRLATWAKKKEEWSKGKREFMKFN